MSKLRPYRTPYDDRFPSCERTCAKLLIYPDDLDPMIITERLNIQPTEAYRKGQPVTNPAGRTRIQNINYWLLSSEEPVKSLDLRRHLDWLLDTIEPSKTSFQELQQDPNVCIRTACVWWSADGGGGPILGPPQMSRLADLNLECEFDLAFYGDD